MSLSLLSITLQPLEGGAPIGYARETDAYASFLEVRIREGDAPIFQREGGQYRVHEVQRVLSLTAPAVIYVVSVVTSEPVSEYALQAMVSETCEPQALIAKL